MKRKSEIDKYCITESPKVLCTECTNLNFKYTKRKVEKNSQTPTLDDILLLKKKMLVNDKQMSYVKVIKRQEKFA